MSTYEALKSVLKSNPEVAIVQDHQKNFLNSLNILKEHGVIYLRENIVVFESDSIKGTRITLVEKATGKDVPSWKRNP